MNEMAWTLNFAVQLGFDRDRDEVEEPETEKSVIGFQPNKED